MRVCVEYVYSFDVVVWWFVPYAIVQLINDCHIFHSMLYPYPNVHLNFYSFLPLTPTPSLLYSALPCLALPCPPLPCPVLPCSALHIFFENTARRSANDERNRTRTTSPSVTRPQLPCCSRGKMTPWMAGQMLSLEPWKSM